MQKLKKMPNNVRNLDVAIKRYAGSEEKYVDIRNLVSNVVVGQLMPEGVIKGGSSLKFRFGSDNTRFTKDFDVARKHDVDKFINNFQESLNEGWNGFTGRLIERKQATPNNVPKAYVMKPFDVKLDFMGKPWSTVLYEVSYNEIGDADEPDYCVSDEIKDIFDFLCMEEPKPMPLMSIPYQIAQKLHGLTEEGSERINDLIDLKIIADNYDIDYAKTREICERLFAYRNMQKWPPEFMLKDNLKIAYMNYLTDSEINNNLEDAISWCNELIQKIIHASTK